MPSASLPSAIALGSIAWQTGAVTGPLVGGFSYDASPTLAYAISAALLGVSLLAMLGTMIFLRATTRTWKVVTLVAGSVLLLSTATLVIDPSGGVVALAGRAVILLAFLFSPALVARHA